MNRQRIVAGLSLSLACAAAGGADWHLVEANEVFRLSIDRQSIRQEGARLRFSYQLAHPVAYENPKTKRRFKVTEIDASIDCARRTRAIHQVTAYASLSGNVVGRYTPSAAEAMEEPIRSGGTDDMLRKYLCDNAR